MYWLRTPKLEAIFLLFPKMQPSINQMSEKFHCFVCAKFCVYLGS